MEDNYIPVGFTMLEASRLRQIYASAHEKGHNLTREEALEIYAGIPGLTILERSKVFKEWTPWEDKNKLN